MPIHFKRSGFAHVLSRTTSCMDAPRPTANLGVGQPFRVVCLTSFTTFLHNLPRFGYTSPPWSHSRTAATLMSKKTSEYI